MWRTGKWAYIDEEDTNSESLPPSPPWKLGQVPMETAIFKDGRRMSKRFEKLSQLKSSDHDTQNPNPSSSNSKKKEKKIKQASSNSQQTRKIGKKKQKRKQQDEIDTSLQVTSPREVASPLQLVTPTPNATPFQTDPQLLKTDSNSNVKKDSQGQKEVAVESTWSPNAQSAISPKTQLPSQSRSTTTDHEATQSFIDPNESYSVDTPIKFSFTHPPPPISNPPPKKFKPWEALKGIHTDGAEVAGDLKLIQEGHLQHQKRLETSARQQQIQLQRRRASELGDTNLLPQHFTKPDEHTSSFQLQSSSSSSSSSSSDLTELSSSLSDLSDDHLLAQPSGSSSMIYSESDLEDDCLPEALVRKVKRPSITNTHKNHKEILKWKRRKSALLQRKERKAALRSMVNQQQSSSRNNQDENTTNSKLDCFQPPPYIKIKANVYPYRKPEVSEQPPAICNCTDGGCGEKCLNRAMFYLCDPKLCKMGQACTNQPFNLRKDLIDETSTKLGKGLKVFYTGPIKGWGLKTEIKLKKDSFLIDYRGEVISREVCYKRVLNDYNGCKHFYLMDYDGSDVIDAGKKGNCARFINHSCSPNLRVERFKLSGLEEYQFGIFTLRDIEVGEELSYDYGWRNFSDIAPTSNVRTSIRTKLKNNKKQNATLEEVREQEDQEEAKEEMMNNNNNTKKSLRKRMKPRTNTSAINIEVVRATAPTVQRCSCQTKGCKGFLGAKKLSFSSSSSNNNNNNNNNRVNKKQKTVVSKDSLGKKSCIRVNNKQQASSTSTCEIEKSSAVNTSSRRSISDVKLVSSSLKRKRI